MTNQEIIRRIDASIDGRRFYEGVNEDGKRQWCYPSITTKIDEVYPKDAFLIKWIREQGMGGQAIFEKAAEDGTEVHIIIDQLIKGEQIMTEGLEEKVKKCVQSFIDWYVKYQPEVLSSEEMLVNHDLKFAGTRDLRCKIGEDIYVIDYKTSSTIHENHKLQLTAYWSCGEKTDKCALLHLGNRTNAGYSFIEFEPKDYEEKMLHFNKTFELLNPNIEPNIKDYPLFFKL